MLEVRDLRKNYGTTPALAGVSFKVDLLAGQKTGLYLDQLGNYQAIAPLAAGKSVLDCFCNQGGFALACARAGAVSVLGIDASEPAVAAATANAAIELPL